MSEQMDLGNIIRRVLRQWQIILMISVTAALFAGIVSSRLYRPQYETKAIIVVYGKESAGRGVSDAEKTANVFQEIITSSLLQKRVAQALGISSLPGTISCQNITNTNMITLRVRADSPGDAMLVMNGILDHYDEAAESLLGSMVLRVLEEPKVPMAAIQQYNEKRMLAKAFLATAAALCVLLLFYYYLRDDIKNEEQVEQKLDTRLFASIYHENIKKGFGFPFRKNRNVGILVNNPVTSFGYIETFQKICTKLEYEAKKNSVILVTSLQENEGKSTISANLALSLAKRGKRVLLVDADLRKPAQFKLFRQTYQSRNNQVGEVLAGREDVLDCITLIGKDGAILLGGNRSYKNSARILVNPAAEAFFVKMKRAVDYVIVDTPPLYLAADAEELMRYADAGLLVVRQNFAKAKDINDAIDIFKKADCRLLGCILNDVETGLFGSHSARSDGYYHKYGYGYNYYHKEKNPKEST